jgi:hypothetical protein
MPAEKVIDFLESITISLAIGVLLLAARDVSLDLGQNLSVSVRLDMPLLLLWLMVRLWLLNLVADLLVPKKEP